MFGSMTVHTAFTILATRVGAVSGIQPPDELGVEELLVQFLRSPKLVAEAVTNIIDEEDLNKEEKEELILASMVYAGYFAQRSEVLEAAYTKVAALARE